MSQVEQRIFDITEGVSVKLPDPVDHIKIKMKNPKYNECVLAEHKFLNSNCKSYFIEVNNPILDIDSENVVNMKDVTDLTKHKFSDEYSLPASNKVESAKSSKSRIKAKMVKFNEKFKKTIKKVNTPHLRGSAEKIRIKNDFENR